MQVVLINSYDHSLTLILIACVACLQGKKKPAALWVILSFYDKNNVCEGMPQIKE